MKKTIKLVAIAFIITSLSMAGCRWVKNNKKGTDDQLGKQAENVTARDEKNDAESNSNGDGKDYGTGDEINNKTSYTENDGKSEQELDLEKVKPDESGKIMVVMFHSFVETFLPGKYDKGEYTMTFKAFEELLDVLYNKGYRLISFKDFLDNNILVPAGCIPMVFTFDDATSGQFNLVEEDGKLMSNKKSAVGIIEEFNKKHPDFGTKGIFFVNLGSNIFNGQGNKAERLKYLIDSGFEIGNHTYSHISLKDAKSRDDIQKELGKNQKIMYELVPGYKMFAFSIPYGTPSEHLMEYVVKGEFEGIQYENLGVVEVGWNPSLSAINRNFNRQSINRVRSPGMNPEKFDLNWWLNNLSRKDEYVSDGNANKVTIPKEKIDLIDPDKLDGKELVTY